MFKNYIKAARLRTLPLSVSGIIVGASLGVWRPFHSKIEVINSSEEVLFVVNNIDIYSLIDFKFYYYYSRVF